MAYAFQMKPDAPDFAVRREVIQGFFEPPIGKSTFYDLVENGKIAKVKGLRGYYRLNESLRRVGLPAVDQLPVRDSGALDDRALADIALSLSMPDELPVPSELLTHALKADEVLKVARLLRAYSQSVKEIVSREERLQFAEGVRDAATMLTKA